MKCPHCNEIIPDESRVCPICYGELKDRVSKTSALKKSEPQPKNEKLYNGKPIIMVALGVLIAVAIIAVVMLCVGKEEPAAQTEAEVAAIAETDSVSYVNEAPTETVEEQAVENPTINRQLNEFAELAKEVADGFIVDGQFVPGGSTAYEAFISPCFECYDKLMAKTGEMSTSQRARFTQICNTIKPAIEACYPSNGSANAPQGNRFNAKVGKYPITIVLAPEGESFSGGYAGYLFYKSKGEDNKIWLKIEDEVNGGYVSESQLHEYVDHKKIGSFSVHYLPQGVEASYATDADEYAVYYSNGSKHYDVTFESNSQKMKFVSLLKERGFTFFCS